MNIFKNPGQVFCKLAEREPLYTVAVDPNLRTSQLTSKATEEFWRGGKVTAELIHAETLPQFASALDFGCGVGRILKFINAEVKHGVDISPDMRRLVHEHTGAAALAPDEKWPSVELVYSVIVIQHIRPEDGLQAISKLLQCARKWAFIHVCVGDPFNALTRKLWRWSFLPGATQMVQLLKHRPMSEPRIPMFVYRHEDICRLFQENNFSLQCKPSGETGSWRSNYYIGKRQG